MPAFSFSGYELAAFEFTWHRLVSFIEDNISNPESASFIVNWKSVAKYWQIPVILPTNLMDFPSVLSRKGDCVLFAFYNPDQYFRYCSLKMYSSMKDYKLVFSSSLGIISRIKDKKLRNDAFMLRQYALTELKKPIQSFVELFLFGGKNKFFYFQIGNCWSLLNLEKLAIKNYRKSLSYDDNYERALLNLAVSLLKLKKRDESIRIFESLLKSSDLEISNLAKYNLGGENYQSNNFSGAINYWAGINTEKLNSTEKIQCWLMQINSLLNLRKYKKVPYFLEKVYKENPSNWQAHFYEAQFAIETNNIDLFLTTSSTIVSRKKPRSYIASIYARRSEYLFQRHEISQALQEIRKATFLAFTNGSLHWQYSDFLFIADKVVSCFIENFLAIIFANKNGRFFNSLGVKLQYIQINSLAIKCFTKGISLLKDDPECVRPYRNLARIYLAMGEIEKVKELIDIITKLSPDSYDTRILLALFFILVGKETDAIQILEKMKSGDEVQILKLLYFKKVNNQRKFEEIYNRINGIKIPKLLQNRYHKYLKYYSIDIK